MKVTLHIEIEVEPDNLDEDGTPRELNAREEKNVAGMLERKVRHRLEALRGARAGGEKAPVGWEVTIKSLETRLPSKIK